MGSVLSELELMPMTRKGQFQSKGMVPLPSHSSIRWLDKRPEGTYLLAHARIMRQSPIIRLTEKNNKPQSCK